MHLVFGLVLPSAVMIFCYSRDIMSGSIPRPTEPQMLRFYSSHKLFILVTLTCIIAWTPMFVILILAQFVTNRNSWKFELFSISLALLGSTANSVMYSFRCPRFRQEVFKPLTFCCFKNKRLPNVPRPLDAKSFARNRKKEDKENY